jgi:L-aspartate oxidase
MPDFDYLVIGGGIAGLTYALDVAEKGSVAVLFKKSTSESSTSYAQGGIAAVHDEKDSFEFHLNDTLTAGAGLVKKDIAEIVVREAPENIARLVSRGTHFDLNKDGSNYDLHREGGHSHRRILHNADATGYEIQRALLDACNNQKNIKFFTNHNAIDLITTYKLGLSDKKNNQVMGVYVLNPDKSISTITAGKVMIATGGSGKAYLYTSNPDVATGDGIAMCYRAGVPIANMEFYQFHPTCLYHPRAKSFLITEAMRGEGALLRRINGERFMPKYHALAELAPRDIVARAIDNEMKMFGDEFVYLDITHRGAEFIKKHFPNIYERCLQYGIDISKEPIPVVPAAHYCCGGAVTDSYARTNIKDLYVSGESACTGLHGANRLASNSLLEGLVFSSRAAKESIETFDKNKFFPVIPAWDSSSARNSDEEIVISQNWDEIRRFMWNYVGIVRSNKRLERARLRSEMIDREIQKYYWDFLLTPDLLELRNLSQIAGIIIRSAQLRQESRGLHYTVDYPESSQSYLKDTVLQITRSDYKFMDSVS